MNKYPSALNLAGLLGEGIKYNNFDTDYYEVGMPLHYYQSGKSNIDLGAVKMLTTAYPGDLTATNDDMCITPIHTILFYPNVDQLSEIFRFLVESNPFSLQVPDSFAQVPLLIACSNVNTTTNIIQLLLYYWPESRRQLSISFAITFI